MFTLVGYSESVDSATLTERVPIPDDHVFISGDDIRVPARVHRVLAAYFNGASITLARIQAPSQEKPALLDVEPLDRAAAPSVQNPPALHVFTPGGRLPSQLTPEELADAGLFLDEDEGLRVLAAEDGAGATICRGFYWLWDGAIVQLPRFTPDQLAMGVGRRVSLRHTDTTGTGTESWTNLGSPTFDQTFQSGWYACTGYYPRSTGMVAARLRFSEGQWHRPGAIGGDAVSDTLHPLFRHGAMGVWGVFKSTQPPTVDACTTGNQTDYVGVLDGVYLGKDDSIAGPLIEQLGGRLQARAVA